MARKELKRARRPIKTPKAAAEATREHRLALTLYQAFLNSNDVMFYCDRDAVILDINDAFTRTYGYTREEAIGQTPRILRSPHSTQDMYQRLWASLLRQGYWKGHIVNRAKDGRELPVILTITAVRDDAGEILGYVSSAVDVSEQVAMQDRVARAEALASLGEMAAMVAHEIRNPMGSIVMAAKQLAGEDLSGEERGLVIEVLKSESQRLNETLTNFLSYARPRELKLERRDLNGMVGEVCHMVEANPDLLKQARLAVRLEGSLEPFPMDHSQIRQVIWNILLNALQAVDGRGEVRVETAGQAGEARLRVSDTGPGIPESARAGLFKPFHTTKRQGTGLGLAIADRIVKAHGGRIEVASPPGQGARFTVILPVA